MGKHVSFSDLVQVKANVMSSITPACIVPFYGLSATASITSSGHGPEEAEEKEFANVSV